MTKDQLAITAECHGYGSDEDLLKLLQVVQAAALEKLSGILASEIECGVFEKHVVPALTVARKVFIEDSSS